MCCASKFCVGAALLAMLSLTGCWVVGINTFSAEQEISETFKTKATPHIVVDTFNGAIDVTPGDKGTVEAKVIKRAGGASQEEAEADLENVEVSMTQEGDTIASSRARRIKACGAIAAPRWIFRYRTARYSIWAPATAR